MIQIIFAGGVYVGKNSAHGAELSETPRAQALRSALGSVELMQSEASKWNFCASHKNYARSVAQSHSNGNPAKRFSFEQLFKNVIFEKLHDDAAAEDGVAIVEHDRLTGCGGALRLVKFDRDAPAGKRCDGARLLRVAVADLRAGAE